MTIAEEIVEKIKKVRDMQKSYAITKDRESLKRCKAEEIQLDLMLQKYDVWKRQY